MVPATAWAAEAEIETAIRCDGIVRIKRDETAKSGIVPAIRHDVSQVLEPFDELVPVEEMIRAQGRTHVLHGDRVRLVIGGDLVQENVAGKMPERAQHGKRLIDELHGAG